jgi:hypothetical protein
MKAPELANNVKNLSKRQEIYLRAMIDEKKMFNKHSFNTEKKENYFEVLSNRFFGLSRFSGGP